ncbi:MAG: V0D/AC39 family V-type ATPase subunit, partial [Lachnospiraceae bacterium]
LDVYYFSYIWKQKDKLLKGKERQIIADSYGRRIDLLNIQWLMRAKKNYRMTAPELYAMVVPSYYHLKPDDITAIVEAPTYEEARLLIVNGYYGQKYADDFAEIRFVEKMYTELVEHIFELAGRKNPYSVAPLNALLYRKEHEIARITSIIEEYAMESQQQN